MGKAGIYDKDRHVFLNLQNKSDLVSDTSVLTEPLIEKRGDLRGKSPLRVVKTLPYIHYARNPSMIDHPKRLAIPCIAA